MEKSRKKLVYFPYLFLLSALFFNPFSEDRSLASQLSARTSSVCTHQLNQVNQANQPVDRSDLSAQSTFNQVAQQATPAVVSIHVIKQGDSEKNGRFFPFSSEDSDHSRSVGIGSGVIIQKDGFILTNNHVVENAEKITVKLDEKHKISAKIVGTDSKTDLAVIKIDKKGKDYPTLSFGDSKQVKVGDLAIAIGSPFGLTRTMTQGVVSAIGRTQMGIVEMENFIQTDAAINPGSSGGPLLNVNGEMIGINTAIFSQGMGFVGIGFAIPAEIANEVSTQLMTRGQVLRGWTGLSVQDINDDFARYFHLSGTGGVLISNVAPRSPADQATLLPGDVILRYNDQTIRNVFEFKKTSAKSPIGSIASLEISRNGSNQTIKLKIGEQPQPFQLAGKTSPRPKSPKSLGLVIEDLPDDIAKVLSISKSSGVLITGVEPGSPASEAGLSIGDIILEAEQMTIHTAKEFSHMAKKFMTQDISMLYVQRGPEERLFIPLRAKT